jgi:hypothetical protein
VHDTPEEEDMHVHEWSAIAAATVLALVLAFQLLLVAGAPFGHAAWGGQHRVLPARLRLASAGAAAIIVLMAWVVLARAGFLPPGAGPVAIRAATWVVAGFFALNTVANAVSRSAVERFVMTPATLFMVACLVILAASPGGGSRAEPT